MTELLNLTTNGVGNGQVARDSNGVIINSANGSTLSQSFGFSDPSLAVNLTTVTQFSSELPFINLLHQSNFDALFGFAPAGGSNLNFLQLVQLGHVAADGTLLSFPNQAGSFFQASLIGQPNGALRPGQYVLTYEGDADPATLDIEGGDINIALSTQGRAVIDLLPGSDRIAIIFDDPNFDLPIRVTSLVHEDDVPLFEAGAIFNPEFLDLYQDFRTIRFVTWQGTNNSTQVDFSDIATVDDLYFGLEPSIVGNALPSGVPLEIMVELANQLGADPWFNIPHLASDAYIREFAQYIRDNLEPGLVAHIEYSNEVWNFGFQQAAFALQQGNALFGDTTTNFQSFVYYGFRSAQVQEIFRQEFGADYNERVHGVLGTQTANIGVLEGALEGVERFFTETGASNAAVADLFDSVGITGYFGENFGDQFGPAVETEVFPDLLDLVNISIQQFNNGQTSNQFEYYNNSLEAYFRDGTRPAEFQAADFGANLLDIRNTLANDFNTNAALASQFGLELTQYEGGVSSVLDIGRFPQTNPATGLIDQIGITQSQLDLIISFQENFFQSANLARLQSEALDLFRQLGPIATLANDFQAVSGRAHLSSDNFGTRNTLNDQASAQAFVFDQFNVGAIDANGNVTAPSAAARFGSINNDRDANAFDHGLTIFGTSSAENINGSTEEDFLVGAGGNDVLRSGQGNDGLNGGTGRDFLDAGTGDDTIIGGGGIDTLLGGDGNDSLDGGAGGDSLDGGQGDDFLNGATNNDTINAGAGNDTVIGASGSEVVTGGQGNDFIDVAAGFDFVDGGSGNDTITSTFGADSLFGGTGNDFISSGTNVDTINGGAGDDTLISRSGFDLIDGSVGNDSIDGGAGPDTLIGGAGNDTIFGGVGPDNIIGGSDNDFLDGATNNDTILGGSGADTLIGASGLDFLSGDEGNDLIDSAGGSDTISGGGGNDTIDSGNGADIIDGGSGNDIIRAGTNSDFITGGAGNDTITGNSGGDTFIFANNFGNDVITDFNPANFIPERIDLSAVTNIINFQDLQNSHLISNVNGDAVIIDGTNSITLSGVNVNQLSVDDFIF